MLKIHRKTPVETGRKLNVHNVQDVFWTYYVRSIYVLFLRGYLCQMSLLNYVGYVDDVGA